MRNTSTIDATLVRLDIQDVLQMVSIEALWRQEPASRIDGVAVVAYDAAGLTVHADCASVVMGGDLRAEDEVASAIAIDGKRTIAQIGGPCRMFRTQVSNDVIGDELPNVAVAEE
ncbi:hypothetical protein OKW40_002526 [Paraburkholderia sp. RAU6.4a]|uniref:hypothetical protein n=1 Tax=Paraburkholderia sp. RAU6.4a TaxID=2991067 RepID=UPI003D202817